MSNGEDDESLAVTPTEIEETLQEIADDLSNADSEAALDAVEESLNSTTQALESIEADDEEAESELKDQLNELEDTLETQRGPYPRDVIDICADVEGTIAETRWTVDGDGAVSDAGEAFLDAVSSFLQMNSFDASDNNSVTEIISEVTTAIETASLDPDDDAAVIEELLKTASTLQSAVEAAESWDDLETNEQLMAEGFYDVLGHYKDFPPELSALKEWEQRGRVDMILLAKDSLQSEFMQNHCMQALIRLGDSAALDEMESMAQRRDAQAIEALGKMGKEATPAVETLIEYVDEDSNPTLQKTTFRALGEIGSEKATQPLANKLVIENDDVRPFAARALGLIGDTRAIRPLQRTIETDDVLSVRAAAGWALRQIGTESALRTVAEYTDVDNYLLQHEAKKASACLEETTELA
ncbi:MAG: PBS lyase HEAT-like repeat protein [Haloquadratum sp. J07HQX50]|nr:MAG: PBS lyase HEAT-like repeat protein [Haloquadratum sp. J07HQX50]